MSFTLLGERVAVDLDDDEDTTDSGLIVPDSELPLIRYGTVAFVGTGREHADGDILPIPHLAVGTRVAIHRFSGQDLNIDGTERRYLTPNEILAVLS